MCGILFVLDDAIRMPDFHRALNTMSYRGPDAMGMMQDPSWIMGHQRLAILDLEQRSNQPYISLNQRYAIIYNGEIYNFRELAQRYQLSLRTRSDTEVLIELYAKLGERMLPELNGMFAFVIVDFWENTWFAARDRLGVKPLFYTQRGDKLILSSEPAAILSLIGSSPVDQIGLRQYKSLRTFFNGHTFWQQIKQFPAGHCWRSGQSMRQWWRFPRQEQVPPSDEELKSLIQDAVHIRQVADVSVGSYLSGGLDSSIVSALSKQPDTWTIGFAEQNEFNYARIVAHALSTQHHEVLMTKEAFLQTAKEMILQRREPLSVPNEVLLYAMTQKVAQKNKVILSGEGADELFFGYDRIFRWAAQNKWNLREFATHYAYGSVLDMEIIEDAIAPFLREGSALAITSAFFQIAHLHGLLRRLDSATMLCSVEARTPFIDYRLIERLAGVSYDWRMAEGVVKAPLKRIFSDLLPTDIIHRPKVGFPVPLELIFDQRPPNVSPMDAWFNFNLSVLFGENVTAEEVA